MTVTEELRRLLDERGVEYRAWDGGAHPLTVWHDELLSYEYEERSLTDGVKPYTGEVLDGTGSLSIAKHVCSPEQAIEATLGRGECRNIYKSGNFKCSECGHFTMTKMVYRDGTPADPRYCPWCGKKVRA